MKVIPTEIEGVVLLEPEVFGDARGYFFESYSEQSFDRLVRPVRFVQDNESMSKYGVLRGLHFQRGAHAQSKLVRVVRGRVLDVAVDIRRGSPTFGRHVSVELSGDNKRQFFVPRGFAHGFSVLSDEAVFQYKCDNLYVDETMFLTLLRKLGFERVQFEKDMADYSAGQKKKVLLARSLCESAHLYLALHSSLSFRIV